MFLKCLKRWPGFCPGSRASCLAEVGTKADHHTIGDLAVRVGRGGLESQQGLKIERQRPALRKCLKCLKCLRLKPCAPGGLAKEKGLKQFQDFGLRV